MFTPIRGASALAGAFVLVAAATAAPPVPVGDLHVQPASLTLTHARRPHSLLVTARSTDGLSLDLTGQATYRSSNDKVATVSVLGEVQPVGTGTAAITVSAAGKATLRVTNTGAVIPPDQVERLFQPFQRLGGVRTGNGDGYGLGLSIVRAIAGAHGATLTSRAQPEGGLDIEVAFPPAAQPRGGPVPLA